MTERSKRMSDQELHDVDAYWRAANYLTIGQIYLLDNPLLREPLKLEHVDQERGYPFDGILATEDQEVFLRPGQTFEGQGQQLAGDIHPGSEPIDPDAGRVDCFGEEMMCRVGFEPECLASQVEGTYLPAAIGKEAIDADGAELDLVESSGLFTLRIDFRTGREEVDGLQRHAVQNCRQARLWHVWRQ